MSDTKIRIAAGTDVGLIRTNNEDNFVVCRDLSVSDWTIPQVNDPVDLGAYGALLVVADGMGGANAGEVASAMAVETVQQRFVPGQLEEVVKSEEAIQDFLVSTVKAADINIANASREDESRSGMGTTIVMAWVINTRAYVCWCGDSRCYVFNPKSGFTRLSKDHSYVQQLIDKGELKPENAHDHPYSNIITQCLGDATNRSHPEVRVYDMTDGDMLLLCSDGLCGLCYDDEILATLIEHQSDDLMAVKDALINIALQAGGHDNVTVALCQTIMEADEDAAPADISTTLTLKAKKSHKGVWLFLMLVIIIAGGIFYLWRYQPDTYNAWTSQLETWLQNITDSFAL